MFLYNDFKLATNELSKVLDLDLAPRVNGWFVL